MWFRPRATDDDRERFVISPHHPDRLQRPAVLPGAAAEGRFQQALIWNVFRTLDLLAPSFWLRRLHLRLVGEPSLTPPQTASVQLWKRLPLPPIQRIDGARPDVIADVVVETEHAVWTLLAQFDPADLADSDRLASVVDAGSWFAGARQHYCGVIEADVIGLSPGSVLDYRYSRSRESARLQSATRGPAAPAQVRWGAVRWPHLAALLQDCVDSDALSPIERELARNAIEWLKRVGIDPVEDAGQAHAERDTRVDPRRGRTN